MAQRLNLVVVCFDTLRYDAVATDFCRTPTLDQFTSEAVVYTNAWGEGEPTIPFRRAAHTGMRSYPWRHHVGDRGSYPNLLGWHAIPDSQTTLAEYLYLRGYATGLISDVWHYFKATMNFVRGFVSWDFVRGQELDTFTLCGDAVTEKGGGRRLAPQSYLYQTRARERDDQYFVAQVLDRAADWLEANRSNAPYFLWVDSFAPHEFWDPPVRFADAYYPAEDLNDHIVPQALNVRPERPEQPDPRDVERTRALYRGYVSFSDERLAHFLERFQRSGADRDTVLVVLSDHGTELWDKGQFGKWGARMHAYNTQLNWMIRHPDVHRRHDSAEFVQNQDLVPTLLHLLGTPCPPLDGGVVWPWANGRMMPRDHIITGWDVYASIRDGRWNLLLDACSPQAPARLFDLAADVREERNVAAEHPEVVARGVARLEALLGAPLPARYTHVPALGFSATPGGLREIRRLRATAGERWQGSNVV